VSVLRSIGSSCGILNELVVTNVYDAAGRLELSTLTGDGVNRVTGFVYDVSGNITQVSGSADGRTDSTKSVFDEAGRVTESVVDPDGLALTTWFGYDARGNQTVVRDPRSSDGDDPQYVTTTTFDVLSRPVVVESPQVDVEDLPGVVTQEQPTVMLGYDTFSNQTHTLDERDNLTVSVFDGAGRVVLITHPSYTDPDGTVITSTEVFDYDPVGNLDFEISRRGNRTDYVYDDANRVVTQLDPLLDGESVRGVTELFYNDAGEAIKTVDQEGAVVEWSYDEMGRVATETRHVTDSQGVESAHVWRYWYDDLGNRTIVEDPDLFYTMSGYNAASELIAQTDGGGPIAVYEYDVSGRQTRVTDVLGRSTRTVYDSAGRVQSVAQYGPDDLPIVATFYGYDRAGNRISMVSPRGHETEWRYDELSRLTQVEVPVSDTDPDVVTSYGYDAAGNPVRVTDGNGYDWYTSYNPWNLQEIITEPSTIQHPDVDDRRWVIGYDAGGLPVSELQPGDVEIVRVFDNLGRMTTETGLDSGISASRVFDFDLAGRLATVSHPSGDNLVYTYDERGLMLTSSGPAGASSFEYDGLGRMISRDDPSAAGYVFTWTGRSEL